MSKRKNRLNCEHPQLILNSNLHVTVSLRYTRTQLVHAGLDAMSTESHATIQHSRRHPLNNYVKHTNCMANRMIRGEACYRVLIYARAYEEDFVSFAAYYGMVPSRKTCLSAYIQSTMYIGIRPLSIGREAISINCTTEAHAKTVQRKRKVQQTHYRRAYTKHKSGHMCLTGYKIKVLARTPPCMPKQPW